MYARVNCWKNWATINDYYTDYNSCLPFSASTSSSVLVSGLPEDFDVSSLESEFAKFGIFGIKTVTSNGNEDDGKVEKSVSVTYSSRTEAAEAAKVNSDLETDCDGW